MAFWVGIERGLAAAAKTALDEEQMEIRRNQDERAEKTFAIEEEKSRLEFLQKTRDLINPGAISLPALGSRKNKSSGGSGLTTKRMMFELQELGVGYDDIMKVVSNAGTPAASNRMLSKIHKTALDYNKGISSGDYIETTPTGEAMASLISDAIITAPETLILDDEWWENTETRLESTFNEEQRNDLYPTGKIVIPGGITFTRDLNLNEYASITDIRGARELLTDITIDIASENLGKIQELQGEYTLIEQGGGELTADQNVIKDFMETQSTILNDAIKGEDLTTLGRIFGTNATNNLLRSQPGIDTALLPSQYNKSNQSPINFNREKDLFLVLQAGLLQNGQVVTYIDENNQRVTRVIGEN